MRGPFRFACLCILAALVVPATAADNAPVRPFIERTLVVAPLQVGDFVLEGTRYDPANRFAGVAIRYFLPGEEATRIDLFVYPHGQGDGEEALDRGMHDFRATLEAAQQAGYYRNLAVADAVEFDIPLASLPPDATDAHQPTDAPTEQPEAAPSDPEQDEAGHIALLAELLDGERHVDGRMIELAYQHPGQVEGEWLPMHSRGYLFYRHLSFFKGRISAAESKIDQAAFAQLADRAMHELVPAVQAYNIGGCGDSTIYVDDSLSDEAMADALMRQLVAAQSRSESSNCHAAADAAELAALAEGAEVVAIDYMPEDWRRE